MQQNSNFIESVKYRLLFGRRIEFIVPFGVEEICNRLESPLTVSIWRKIAVHIMFDVTKNKDEHILIQARTVSNNDLAITSVKSYIHIYEKTLETSEVYIEAQFTGVFYFYLLFTLSGAIYIFNQTEKLAEVKVIAVFFLIVLAVVCFLFLIYFRNQTMAVIKDLLLSEQYDKIRSNELLENQNAADLANR